MPGIKWVYCIFRNKRIYAIGTNAAFCASFLRDLDRFGVADEFDVVRFKPNSQLNLSWQNVTKECLRAARFIKD